MPNYSKDSDLVIYERDIGSITFDLSTYHAEAKREIDRRLRTRGMTDAQLGQMTAQTIADLVPVSSTYVLALVYSALGAEEKALAGVGIGELSKANH